MHGFAWQFPGFLIRRLVLEIASRHEPIWTRIHFIFRHFWDGV